MILIPLPKPWVQIGSFSTNKFTFIVGRHINAKMIAELKVFIVVDAKIIARFDLGVIDNEMNFKLKIK